MPEEIPWYENDRLWEAMSGILFRVERWDAATKEIDYLIDLLELPSEADVLDLCCGPGRHSIDLARRGYKVTGVDRTEQYLTVARDKAAWEGLKIEFVQKDMRQFSRPEAFDVTFSMFTSFGYFDDSGDDRIVVENVFSSLKPGGKWVIDVIGKEVLARIFQARDWDEIDDAIILEERTPNADWSIIKMRWILIKNGQMEEFILNLRLYSAQELSTLLKSVGFSRVNVYGDLKGAPYDHKAKRLIVVGQK
jgi:SAM-dependent methyltransferase